MTFLPAFLDMRSRLIFSVVHYVYKILISINYSLHCDVFFVENFVQGSNIHLHLLQAFYITNNRLRRTLHKIIIIILSKSIITINVNSTKFIHKS